MLLRTTRWRLGTGGPSKLRLAVIGFVDSVREQEFRLTLRSVAFDRNDHSRQDEDAVAFLLGDYDAAFFNSEAFA